MNEKTILVYSDGATVGHNGKLGTVSEVGIGIWIPDFNVEISERMPGISNNEAEFKALIRAMIECINLGISDVSFQMDSCIVVNRANGSKPKKKKHQNERMDNLQNQVLGLEKLFDFVEFIWIPREKNSKADELSKKVVVLN